MKEKVKGHKNKKNKTLKTKNKSPSSLHLSKEQYVLNFQHFTENDQVQ